MFFTAIFFYNMKKINKQNLSICKVNKKIKNKKRWYSYGGGVFIVLKKKINIMGVEKFRVVHVEGGLDQYNYIMGFESANLIDSEDCIIGDLIEKTMVS